MASSVTDDDYDSDDSCGSSDTGAINDSDTDSGNSSDADTRTTDATDQLSDVGSDEEEDEDEDGTEDEANIAWSGVRKTIPIMLFRPECIYTKVRRLYATGEKYHLAYKMVRTECKVVHQILRKHGFRDVHPNSSDFNLMWTGSHVKPYTLRSLTEFQKVNHFPRSYEITRKDRLYKNFQRMQQSKGVRHFDFLPQTFVTPTEYDDLVAAHMKERGTWIVKPVASSRGRGISLINNPQHVPMDGNHVVSRYISNPLLIDGFKFDCRLYVAVTSFDPLRAYLYEEGLARFATVQYNHTNKTIKNVMMHLTNYSLNKRSNDYVRCNDLNIEDYGNKWSFGAMVRYLQKKGKDVKGMLGRIEEVVSKTLLCAELPVATACKMFMPHRGNCFELYGFDILIDENLKPWVLEVNLSPSLACDAPIDLKIKSNMVSDLFSLIGFIAQDPMMRRISQSKRNQELAASSVLRQQRQRPQSASVSSRPSSAKKSKDVGNQSEKALTAEERRVVTESKDEYQRRVVFVNVVSSCFYKYRNFLESRTNLNQVLHSRLYPDNMFDLSSGTGLFTRAKKVTSTILQELADRELQEHLCQFTRKLDTTENVSGRKQVRNKVRQRYPTLKRMFSAGVMRSAVKSERQEREPLVQGKLEDTQKSSAQAVHSRSSQPTGHKPGSSSVTSSQSSLASGKAQQDGGRSGTQQDGGKGRINPSGKPPVAPPAGSKDNKGARMVLEVQKQPSAKEIRESINVPEIMNSGGDISKLQARLAFATYLLRVQQRLLDETHKPPELLEESAQNDEQMDLVLRFLKRAAGNLQQPFKVIVPSRKLPAHDRRRVLAKQLVDFVQIYNKETEQMDLRRKMDQKLGNPTKDKENDPTEDRFSQFTTIATESELEELLTTYTKQNKSASIFLGTSCSPVSYKHVGDVMARPVSSTTSATVAGLPEGAQPGCSNTATSLHHQRHHSGEGSAVAHGGESRDKETGAGDAAYPISATQNRRPQSTPSGGLRPTSSDAVATSSYGAQTNSSRQRPVSAKMGHRDTGGNSQLLHRPTSAFAQREPPGGEIAARLFSESSQQAIQEALQRLARRQAVRQYSASSSQNQNVVTQQYLQHYNSGGSGGIIPAPATGHHHQASASLTSAARASAHASRSSSSLVNPHQHQHSRGHSWDGLRSQSNSTLDGSMPTSWTAAQPSISQSASASQLRNQFSSQDLPVNGTNVKGTADEPRNGDGEMLWKRDTTGAHHPQQQRMHNPLGSQHFQNVLQQNGLRSPSNPSSDEGGRAAQKQPLSLQEKRQISHDMTQQSKAKHQEKIAQAHSNASALREALQRNAASSGHPTGHSSNHAPGQIKPRPPVKSSQARKPVSVQRMARTTQLDEPSPTAPSQPSPTFYSGLKYNNMTGTTKVPSSGISNIYNSGYQSAVVRH
ncbi:tubulin polyglutamylase TTLL5-like [Acanthaster planci]|uniref:Tubulin--tyrosine ligase-like protein 5 n=1 Tax=Acanthaster planci TaxID=133434 RepID=A0A8B7YBE4_ACAPL|nr:tubulin polyglutamylase TTLL5-like [Acanthaster planci]